jgi:hypothetical protein
MTAFAQHPPEQQNPWDSPATALERPAHDDHHDPEAEMERIRHDRAAARQELAGRFIVTPAAQMPANPAPNQVTPEQLDEVARNYSDIRLGRSDVRIDTHELGARDATRFRAQTMEQLAEIMQTQSGRELVGGLSQDPRHRGVTIGAAHENFEPLERSQENDIEGGATGPYVEDVTVPVTAAGMDSDDARAAMSDPRRGSGARIGVNLDPPAGYRGDVTLMHEMVHAYHMTRGTLPPRTDVVTAPGVDQGLPQAEHQATGLGRYTRDPMTENAYRAERARIGRGTVGVVPGDAGMAQRPTYR